MDKYKITKEYNMPQKYRINSIAVSMQSILSGSLVVYHIYLVGRPQGIPHGSFQSLLILCPVEIMLSNSCCHSSVNLDPSLPTFIPTDARPLVSLI